MDITPLFTITTQTPIGDLRLIIDRRQERNPSTRFDKAHRKPLRVKKTADIVIASGFGSLRTLRNRLSEEHRTRPLQALDVHPYSALVARYFKGDKKALDKIDYEQEGTHFLCTVWDAMQKIPYGKVTTYSELAKASGSARAVRAVGSACARNQLVLLVPCHRVVKSDGSLGNYAYGVKIKQWLLEHEL